MWCSFVFIWGVMMCVLATIKLNTEKQNNVIPIQHGVDRHVFFLP